MDLDIQKYYENRFSMFGTQGWKDLIADIEVMRDSTDSLSGIKSAEDFRFKQGELSILNWMLGLDEISAKVYEDLKDAGS